jgi:hypothetical protein
LDEVVNWRTSHARAPWVTLFAAAAVAIAGTSCASTQSGYGTHAACRHAVRTYAQVEASQDATVSHHGSTVVTPFDPAEYEKIAQALQRSDSLAFRRLGDAMHRADEKSDQTMVDALADAAAQCSATTTGG